MGYNDPFADVEPTQPRRQQNRHSGRRDDGYDQPLDDVSRKDVAKATGTGGSVMHGTKYQLTTRIPLELLEAIREWAAFLETTQQDLQRYCFYRGLLALEEGERPEFEEVVVRKKLKPPY